jgi:hypothetical protein
LVVVDSFFEQTAGPVEEGGVKQPAVLVFFWVQLASVLHAELNCLEQFLEAEFVSFVFRHGTVQESASFDLLLTVVEEG